MTRQLLIAIVLAGCALPHIAHALEGDRWSLYAGVNATYDNNLFRLPDGVNPPPQASDSRGDFILSPYLRGVMDLPVSRQRFRVDATVSSNRYSNATYLDYNAVNGTASWLWALGSRWNGTATFAHVQQLTSFADVRSFQQNILRAEIFNFSADYWIHPAWRLVAGAGETQVRNSTNVLSFNDLNQYYVDAGVRYLGAEQNFVRLSARYTNGDYPNRTVATNISDKGFTQYDLGIDGFWQTSGTTQVSGRIAYTQRNYPTLSARDFSGPTGNILATWLVTPKTGVNLNVLRDIGEITDVTANYIVTNSASISPYWLMTSRVRWDASYQYVLRDYAGSPLPLVFDVPKREDRFNIARLSVTYTPTRNWLFSAGYVYSDRTSNYPGQQYTDSTINVTAQFGW